MAPNRESGAAANEVKKKRVVITTFKNSKFVTTCNTTLLFFNVSANPSPCLLSLPPLKSSSRRRTTTLLSRRKRRLSQLVPRPTHCTPFQLVRPAADALHALLTSTEGDDAEALVDGLCKCGVQLIALETIINRSSVFSYRNAGPDALSVDSSDRAVRPSGEPGMTAACGHPPQRGGFLTAS